MSLVRPDGAADLYDGALRVSDAAGLRVFDQIDVHTYPNCWSRKSNPGPT